MYNFGILFKFIVQHLIVTIKGFNLFIFNRNHMPFYFTFNFKIFTYIKLLTSTRKIGNNRVETVINFWNLALPDMPYYCLPLNIFWYFVHPDTFYNILHLFKI